jgi:hypothetical protein
LPVRPSSDAERTANDLQLGAAGPFWQQLRDADAGEKVQKGPLLKGKMGPKVAEDMPADGGLLIGFEITVDRFVKSVQPIYLTSSGEKLGKIHGTPTGTPVTVKASPGYAVGAINVRAGDLLDGVTVIYMRVNDNGLNANDAYRSALVGSTGGEAFTVGGDGSFVIGIRGRVALEDFGGDVPPLTTLGVITLKR